MHTEIGPEVSEEQALLFFQQLKRELRFESTQRVVSLIRLIFSKLRTSYTAQQLAGLIARTPSLFHLLFINNNIEERAVSHLDELADALYLEGRENAHNLFPTEIDALRSVTVVLVGIQRLLKQIGFEPYNYTLSHELQQAVQQNS